MPARSKPVSLIRSLRAVVWPRGGWIRMTRHSIRRLRRLHGSPHAIALGFAAGVFVSFTPFLGFHILFAALIALLMRGSLVAAALGTLVGNPLTFPFIWFASYELGELALGRAGAAGAAILEKADLSYRTLFSLDFSLIWPIFWPLLIGGLLLGAVVSVVSYLSLYPIIRAYQARRLRRRAS